MTLLAGIFLGTTIVFLSLFCLVTYFGLKVSRHNQQYELFYQDTIDELGGVAGMLEKLMERQMVSDDPDVQNVYRVIVITHDILKGYINAGFREEGKKKEK